MGTMNVIINDREYAIACDDGQEAHLGKLAQIVNDRVKELSRQMGRGAEHIMLMYTTLMLADELNDAKTEVARLRQQMETAKKTGKMPVDHSKLDEMEQAMAQSMQQIAGRIEQLADQLEAA